MPLSTPQSLTLTSLVRTLVVLLCLGGTTRTIAAQSAVPAAPPGTGTVEGTARSAEGEGDTPIPFALVRLLPAAGQAGAPLQGITSAAGRFRFVDVPAGDYRVQLLRIGYAPVLSAVLQVRAGAVVQSALRGPTATMQLATVVVRPGGCLQGAALAADSSVSTLWNEARKGVELRRGIELRYGYTRVVRTIYEPEGQRDGKHQRVTADTLVSAPDSVLVREQRVRRQREKEGYGKPNALRVPNEKEMLDDDFLTNHCLEAVQSDDQALVGLRFRPTTAQRNGLAIRGTIWLEPATFLIRRLDLEHVSGKQFDTAFSAVRIDYGDVSIGGHALRLAVGGDVSIFETRAHATMEFGYGGFEDVRAP